MSIEDEFQKMVKAAYGSTMLAKDQIAELRLAFVGGYMMGHNATLCAAVDSTEDGEKVLELHAAICEAFTKANEDR